MFFAFFQTIFIQLMKDTGEAFNDNFANCTQKILYLFYPKYK